MPLTVRLPEEIARPGAGNQPMECRLLAPADEEDAQAPGQSEYDAAGLRDEVDAGEGLGADIDASATQGRMFSGAVDHEVESPVRHAAQVILPRVGAIREIEVLEGWRYDIPTVG